MKDLALTKHQVREFHGDVEPKEREAIVADIGDK